MMQRIFDIALAAVRLTRQAVHWWFNELMGLVPDRWKNRRLRIELEFEKEGVSVRLVRGDQRIGQGQIDEGHKTITPPTLFSHIEKLKNNVPIWLLAPPDVVLTFTLQVPRTAYPNFAKLLPLEIERRTPYRHDEIVVGWKHTSQTDKSVDIELRYITRALLAKLTNSVAGSGLIPTIVVLGPDSEFRIIDTGRRTALASAQILGRQLSRGALAAAVLVFIIADEWSTQNSKIVWQNKVDQESQLLKRQQSLQKQISDLSAAIGAAYPATISASETLASLARKLPPSDWLTEISFRNRVVTLRGYAASPDLLIKQLEPLANNRIVSLQGETALDVRLSRQRFALSFQLEEKNR